MKQNKRPKWVERRLQDWGWEWDARLQRLADPDSPSVPCTLGADGTIGTVPGSRVLMRDYDWIKGEIRHTHLAVLTLTDIHRQVVWWGYVYPHLPVKTKAVRMEIQPSTYYQRMNAALDKLSIQLRRPPTDMEKLHMEFAPLIR